jgi:hypothetical protein
MQGSDRQPLPGPLHVSPGLCRPLVAGLGSLGTQRTVVTIKDPKCCCCSSIYGLQRAFPVNLMMHRQSVGLWTETRWGFKSWVNWPCNPRQFPG